MPWKASSVMEEKLRFVFEYEQHEQTMRDVCQSFGISRETGYFWLRRYQTQGVLGLAELNRGARRHPNQTSEEIEQLVLDLRQAHMRWGPRKLKRVLERDQPGRRWPATSTIGEMLRREGLVVPRRKRRRTAPYTQPLAHAAGPNQGWCADCTGWFRTGDGQRIEPLTISDAHSRYLLRCQAVEKMDTARVQAIFEAAFRQYGLPGAIRTDNGVPFGFDRAGGAVAAGGVVDQAGDRAGAHRRRTSRAERTARALASHPEAGSGHAAGQRTAGTTARLRSLPPGVQPGAPA